jgi:PAS domain S-box-containing protein
MPKALIVVDKSENLYLLESLLKGNGYEVTGAANGREALEHARKQPPDLLISDILMPVMDGYTLCREWKHDARLRDIPFVFYTATYTDPKDEELALSLGADLFMVKPVEPDAFMSMIREVVGKHQARTLVSGKKETPDETAYLREYNEALIRKLEDKLEQLEEANRALAVKDFAIASSMSGIAITDLAGCIISANDSFMRIFGNDKKEIIGQKCLNWFAKDADADAIMGTIKSDKGYWEGELERKKNDGSIVYLQVALHLVRDGSRKPICIMLSCADITERRLMREELQQTQRLEALRVFAGSIAHDFNNFLGGIFGNVQLAQMELPADSPALKRLELIVAVFDRAKSLTQRLLTFSKSSAPQKQDIDIQEILSECCALSLSGSNVLHQLHIDEKAHLVEGDANQLSQVFNNLIINARQAMPEGGTVAISARNVSLSDTQVGRLRKGEYTEITVKDNGCGIAPEALPRIFDPFFTTKEQGTGLGLAVSYAIVNSHGGHISASSTLDTGSVFTVYLPVSGKHDRKDRTPAIPQDFRGSGRVLIMDDDEVVRNTAKRLLEIAGYEVTTATRGEEAIAAYRQSLSSGNVFAAVILDLTIRGGMGGARTIVELHKIDPHASVIVSSGYSDDPVFVDPKKYGFVAAIPKPYLAHELYATIKAVITDRGARG